MRSCEFCGAENLDSAKHCVACNEPMTAADAAEDAKTTDVQHHKQLVRREVLVGVAAVALLGAAVWGVMRSNKRKALREEMRHYYTALLDADTSHVPEFWKCVARADKVPKDNLELESGVESAINKSKGGYAKFVRSKCINLVNNAPTGLIGIVPPPQVQDTHEKYVAALRTLKKDADAFIESIAVSERYYDDADKLKKVGTLYHLAEAESADTWAWDKFLRCAVPDVQKMADIQAVLEYLGTVMQDPVSNVTRWQKECYPIIQKTEGTTAHADYKTKVEAFSKDDRDVQAFQDVAKGAFDKQRKAAIPPFTKAWYNFATVRDEHFNKVGTFLAD